ncbi:hypothetical protein HYDPIDRAFT_26973 [Hydnomerulius pinastri MD-312]|nr:hypothetical protein HYDPIDRAFT_26973 [Hydnomerulius pinastri MD-312]
MSTHITTALRRAIGYAQAVQPNPDNWVPELERIVIDGKECETSLRNSQFRKSLRAELSAASSQLFGTAYFATRSALAPTPQPLANVLYPRMCFFRSLTITTAEDFGYAEQLLVWNPTFGHGLFHNFKGEVVTELEIEWFMQPQMREMIYHFFRLPESISFLGVHQSIVNSHGVHEWVLMLHASDEALAFALAWIATTIEVDILRRKAYTIGYLSSLHRALFIEHYQLIKDLFRGLRQGTIAGLPQVSREKAIQGLDDLQLL